jgi:hypothetical protein
MGMSGVHWVAFFAPGKSPYLSGWDVETLGYGHVLYD